ncbi:MAG: choloylglycine hydrolase family protein [Acidobacteriaceae bacterium]
MCTDFLLRASDGSVVNGRSMEFGSNLHSELLICGRGTPKHSRAPDREHGLRWTTTFGYIGMNVFGGPIVADGMNEAGLAVGCLWLPNITRYKQTVSDPAKALIADSFVSWALGNFATVAQVADALNAVEVWGDKKMETSLPLHFSIHDKAGDSIVIELLDGSPSVHRNPVAVLTNAPAFTWHLANIGTFVGLAAQDVNPITIGSEDFCPPGHGSGMRGLPGDSTPPSRFIRTVFQKNFAVPPDNNSAACNLAIHLLNTVDIPKGTSAALPTQNEQSKDDHTQWIVVKALTQQTFSFRTYDNPTMMQVDLAKLDFSTPGENTHPLPSTPVAIDITEKVSDLVPAQRPPSRL